MYTECPGCQTAFRVTAEMLQQAAGHVRCGDCGRAFNALENLSEDLPDEADDPGMQAATEEDERALLDTLEEFVGPARIRIEDTGVEWRVYEDEESVEAADISPAAAKDELDDTASVRWYIEDVPLELQESLDLATPSGSSPEARYDDNTPLPDTPDDDDRAPLLSDPPRRRAEDQVEPRSPELDERQADFALSEPDDWTDLLAEVGQPAETAVPDSAGGLERTDIRDLDSNADEGTTGVREEIVDLPSDIDTQFDLQAQVLGIDLTGNFDATGEQPNLAATAVEMPAEQDLATANAAEWPTIRDDTELTLVADEEENAASGTDEYVVLETPDEGPAVADDAGDREPTGEFERRIAHAAAAFAGKDREHDGGGSRAGAASPRAEPAGPEHPVPPQTEEEMTINMLIDRDLLRLAAEEDVFRTSSRDALKAREQAPFVETIIMEGDIVRHAIEPAPPAVESMGDLAIPGGISLKDTYVTNNERISGATHRPDLSEFALAAGVAVLGLLFAAQVVHAYRETLATYGAFDQTVGSVYRLFGAPITPDWDIGGWQFEAPSGNTAENDRVLTISSRITNRSERSLPYPLLHVSLMDRWDEIIGSRMLQPDEYLKDDTDTHGFIVPGDKFTAEVTIASLSPEATGFKLNVCYRLSGDHVRCAAEAFKD